MALARFELEQKPAKPTWKSKTFRINTAIFVLALLAEVQKYLDGTLHIGDQNTLMLLVVQAQNILGMFLRVYTGGPLSGTAAAFGIGASFAGKKIAGAAKSAVSVLPGVNIK
jgi:fructose-specific phosphotransferase system IIC component